MRYAFLVLFSLVFGLADSTRAMAVGGLDLKSAMKKIETTRYIFRTGLFNAIFAKEMCSCLYVDHTPLATCQANDNLPAIAHQVVKVTAPVSPDDPDESKERIVTARFTSLTKVVGGVAVKLGPPASAKYTGPEFGCVMTSPGPAAIP